MREDKLHVLKMLEDGKITSDEAVKLLEAVDEVEKPKSSNEAKWIRIRVTETGSSKSKVNVNIPIGLVDALLKILPKHVKMSGLEEIDLQEIIRAVKEGASGKLVEVEEENERVEIIVE